MTRVRRSRTHSNPFVFEPLSHFAYSLSSTQNNPADRLALLLSSPPTAGNHRLPTNSKKNQAPGQKTRRYKRDIDQILEDLKDNGAKKMSDTLLHNDVEDLPGELLCLFLAPAEDRCRTVETGRGCAKLSRS